MRSWVRVGCGGIGIGWRVSFRGATRGSSRWLLLSSVGCINGRLHGRVPLMMFLLWTGNPSVILIDEFSTGVDAKMKRDMWSTLKNVAVGKAIVITTRK